MASAAAAARAAASPPAPGPAGAAARKVSLPSPPRPGAAARRAPTPAAPTLPGAGGRRRPGCDSSLSPTRAPASQGVWGPREAGAIRTRRARTLARSQVTSPPLRSQPTTAARAGFPPARAPARPRSSARHGHEHEHTRPALSSRFPRPAHLLGPPLRSPQRTRQARGAGLWGEATPARASPGRAAGLLRGYHEREPNGACGLG